MSYAVIELQSDGNTVSVIPTSYTDRNDAENKYHTILAYAAKSDVVKHSAVMLEDDGHFIKSERYTHEVEPEQEVSE